MNQRFAGLGILILIIGVMVFIGEMLMGWGDVQAQPTAPRPSLADELTRLNETEETFTLTFTVGLPLWGSSVEINGSDGVILERIGSDYACLARPSESITQTVCVPYAQVAAVLFAVR